ncbi:MAG: N-ethylammeline chlorohydrolase [Chlorobiaceae bacterium]|nr:N-ethylammeline chlorohydrolase [Chlorobiaceae bacterium]
MSIVIKAGTIITANQNRDILTNTSVVIDNNRISGIYPENTELKNSGSEVIDATGLILIPGFIQTHLHLCQTLFRGLADDLQLLDWLQLKIFPMEAAHNAQSMFSSALIGIAELIRSGTTTILDMGSVNYQEEIIRAIGETGFRAFVGKAMMDVNELYPPLKESTADSLRSTKTLAEQWHNSFNGRIKYAVAPRFVLSCSDSLMQEAYELTSDSSGILFHTHASENKNEIEKVFERCGMANIEFLNKLGILSNRSVLAHCVHLNKNEFSILQDTKTNVSHCPSSNLKLGSGIADVPALLSKNISVSIGADGAPCNNTLDLFQEMRLASLIQKPFYGSTSMPAETIFRMATINGAHALGIANEIGSIELGKKADLVLLDLENIFNPLLPSKNLYSSIVHSASPENVDSVMIDGKWVYRKKENITSDIEKIRHDAKKELHKLISRIESY